MWFYIQNPWIWGVFKVWNWKTHVKMTCVFKIRSTLGVYALPNVKTHLWKWHASLQILRFYHHFKAKIPRFRPWITYEAGRPFWIFFVKMWFYIQNPWIWGVFKVWNWKTHVKMTCVFKIRSTLGVYALPNVKTHLWKWHASLQILRFYHHFKAKIPRFRPWIT